MGVNEARRRVDRSTTRHSARVETPRAPWRQRMALGKVYFLGSPVVDSRSTRPRARDRSQTGVRARNRILFRADEVDGDEARVAGLDARARHAREVLGASVGSTIRAGVIDEGRCSGTIIADDGDDGEFIVALSAREGSTRAPRVDLLLATPRPKVLRRMWAPLAAMGVGRVFLANASKVERYYFDSKALERETIREEILRGLEQAGDYIVPQIGVAKRLPPIIDRLAGKLEGNDMTNGFEWLLGGDRAWTLDVDVLLLAHPGESRTSVADALAGVDENSRVLIAIGPEGGWTEYELDMLEHAGFRKIALGTRTLTTDVACISLISAVRERLQAWE